MKGTIMWLFPGLGLTISTLILYCSGKILSMLFLYCLITLILWMMHIKKLLIQQQSILYITYLSCTFARILQKLFYAHFLVMLETVQHHTNHYLMWSSVIPRSKLPHKNLSRIRNSEIQQHGRIISFKWGLVFQI